jgi:hypothetical protein
VALLIKEELLGPAAGCASALRQCFLGSEVRFTAASDCFGRSRKGTGVKTKKERTKKVVDRADAAT